MAKPAIEVRRMSKYYRLGTIGMGTLKESLSGWWARVRGRYEGEPRSGGGEPERSRRGMWALREISFSVEPGEILGLVGHNGSGKSTLLKILSRITAPTEGEAILRGRATSLLEVGSGFHPELTGLENIYLNGAILGMRKREITAKLDSILDFAQIEGFADTPVKHYSSGMYLKLAFAVAANLEHRILMIDEVLAVGDDEFRNKCMEKTRSLALREGRTVIFVSHNMEIMSRLCHRCLLLDHGRMVAHDTPEKVIELYLSRDAEALERHRRLMAQNLSVA